jgi:lycopene beta-cyclase
VKRVVICGGGLAGGLAAIALAKRRPDLDLLLVEQGTAVGGNHIWSFFDSDIAEDCRWLIDHVARRRWPDHEVRFPARARVIDLGYNSVQSSDLDAAVRTCLRPAQLRLGELVSDVGENHVCIGADRIEADCVIDARGPGPMTGLELGWQKFVGRVFRFADKHNVIRPMIMDGTVPQIDGFRFIYLLPLNQTDLLIEDTYYSASPVLDCDELARRLASVANSLGGAQTLSEERGVLPVVISGTLDKLWPRQDAVPRLGLRGGFFHPTTGYSLPDAVRNAALLSGQQDFSTSAINALLRGRAERLWRDRHFYQLLNRMLFRAAEPAERYRVLEHFYRLPQSTIARFYAARLNALDKLRILSGSPPVPLGRALSALRSKAA